MSSVAVRPAARAPLTLLATERWRTADDLDTIPLVDRPRRGAVAVRMRRGLYRRAEPGPCGPLIFEAARRDEAIEVQVWGPAATPADDRERALDAARGWVGRHDDPPDLAELTADLPVLRDAARQVGTVRLSRVPRVQEAVGRSVLAQLVQSGEAHRSMVQLAAMVGQPATRDLWCWPTADQIARTPAFSMRRCGVSLRNAVALHAGAMDDPQLERVRHDYVALDRRLRAIRGVGVWTSAETRLALGDPDAVSVGDYNLYEAICHGLAGTPREECSDALMLELLAPWPGQRGRIIQLVVRAVYLRLLPRLGRRAPRAAQSEHRYW